MKDRVILHSDMNSFYASVEILLRPELAGKPVAVCGSAEDRHGIVLAKSEAAKRCGVRTAMTNGEALAACPSLIIVPPQYDQYVKFSRQAKAIYARYTDYIEPFGMDESWLDVTESGICGSGVEIAELIRRDIREELGLTVSVGVSWNKIYAKLGSDMKKPDGLTVITRDNYKKKVWPLPASELLYVGRATGRKLAAYGIRTIGDLAQTDEGFLKRLLGKNGLMLKSAAAGTDPSRVMHRDCIIPPKSVGHGVTCSSDLCTPAEVYRVMLELSQDIGHRLRAGQCLACGISIFLRDPELGFHEAQMHFPQATRSPEDITEKAFFLYRTRFPELTRIRQVTLQTFALVPETDCIQASLFVDQQYAARRELAEAAIDGLRQRFGKTSVQPASLLLENKIPHDGRHLVRMPAQMYR